MIGSFVISVALLVPLTRWARQNDQWEAYLIALGCYLLGGVSYALWLIG